jgi:hypothetical protein
LKELPLTRIAAVDIGNRLAKPGIPSTDINQNIFEYDALANG